MSRLTGTRNHKTRALALAAIGCGLTPIEYLLMVMRDESNPIDLRLDAAKAAAPYIHPRLAQIQHADADGKRLDSNQVVFLGGVLAPPRKNDLELTAEIVN